MARSATGPDRTLVDYGEAEAAQRGIAGRRRAGEVPDILWLLEHPPTITWGSSGGRRHLLLGEAELRARGIALSASERGGDVTFHEPGQLVGYPIVDLGGPGERDMHRYLRAVEAGIIGCLRTLGIDGVRIPGRTGVWIEGSPPRKIAALGVRAKGWVTSHGFALNVENPLAGFELIVPCGIEGAAVTSVEREIGRARVPPWGDVCRGAHEALERALGRKLLLLVGTEGLAPAGITRRCP